MPTDDEFDALVSALKAITQYLDLITERNRGLHNLLQDHETRLQTLELWKKEHDRSN